MAIKQFLKKAVGSIPGGQLITEGVFGGRDARLLPTPSLQPTTQRTGIGDVTSGWFTPLQPMPPFAPPGTTPRQFAYLPGSNILWQPKTGEAEGVPGITFDVLRFFADSWDLLRLVIETAKDRVMRVPWEVRPRRLPGESSADYEKRGSNDKLLKDVQRFFAKPDGRRPFKKWMRMWLEDMYVIDAVAIYAARDKKKRIAAFRPYDGATFNRLLTDEGLTPIAPDPAYQQVLYGIVSDNFSTDDLFYSMRNERTCRRYGYGKVEQCIISINLGLRRLEWLLQEYTSGNIPEALVFMPVGGDSGLTVDDVKRAQEDFNTMMQGNLATRRQMRFLPSYNATSGHPPIVFPKEPLLKDPLDEWLARILLFNFGMSPQYFERQMNRATAGQAQETAEEEGLIPDLEESKMVLDGLLEMQGLNEDYEWAYDRAREMDPVKQAEADVARVKEGLNTRNEIRKQNGDDPSNNPMADKLTITTASGAVELGTQPAAPADMYGNAADEPGKQPGDGKQPATPKEKQPAAAGDKKGKKGEAEKLSKKVRRRHVLQAGTLTHESEEARASMVITLAASFGRMRGIAVKQARQLLKASAVDDVVAEIMAALKDEFTALPEAVQNDIAAAAASGVAAAAVDTKVTSDDMLASTNEAAQEFSRQRAAELVGMSFDESGDLVPNPNARWTITDSTRTELHDIIEQAFGEEKAPLDEIIQQIEDAASFSTYRAEMVARTEISRAQVHGVMDMWRESGLVETYVWLQSEDEDVCEVCEEMAEGGPYEFGNGPVPIDDTHPNCRCIIAVEELAEEVAAVAQPGKH